MQAIILAGGLGTRLEPFTKIIPKPLLPIGDKSVLEIQISQLKKHGFDEIIFATNYKSDLLESYFGDGSKFGIHLIYSREKIKLGTCGPLALVRDILHEPFVVMNGDILTNLNFEIVVQFHRQHKGPYTMVTKEVTYPLRYGNVTATENRVVKVEEKPDIKVEVVAGIYVMSSAIFDYIPLNEHFGMDDLIRVLFKRNVPMYRYAMDEYWLDIGQMADYEKAQKLCLDEF